MKSNRRRPPDPAARRRRYVVHLSCISESDGENCQYVVRIAPSAARIPANPHLRGRAFADECELISTINPLLPAESDVRDVFDHIEAPNGFFYLLWLTDEEAAQLGWSADDGPGQN